MQLFLIRHGETVDNVAGLYAGIRDSALTTHGVLQTRRLADHLSSNVRATHVFSSDLQRAFRTATALCNAQERSDGQPVLTVERLTELREKNFGSGEGTKFSVSRNERAAHVGSESPEAMRARADIFLNDHLLPLLQSETEAQPIVCIVVAHGLILSSLFKALSARVAGQMTVSIEAQQKLSLASGPDDSIRLPSWSNTGFLECKLSVLSNASTGNSSMHQNENRQSASNNGTEQFLKMHILRVNCTAHLLGLKKTRGGIGSAQFDDKQKTLSSFFSAVAPSSKKRKSVDDATASNKKVCNCHSALSYLPRAM